MTTTLLISSFPPFPSLTLTVPSDTPLSQLPSYLPDYIRNKDVVLTRPSGVLTLDSTPLKALWAHGDLPASDPRTPSAPATEAFLFCSADTDNTERTPVFAKKFQNDFDYDADLEHMSHRLISFRLSPRVRGGKGGFGSQLRAAGGRMSSQKTSNNDSCRDLNGRRLSTVKEAKALAAYIESEPERLKAAQEEKRVKLERLERKLGIDGNGNPREEGSSSGGKRRFDDIEYLEQSKDIVDNVKNAVTAGLLKKRKKAKASSLPGGGEVSIASATSILSKVSAKDGTALAGQDTDNDNYQTKAAEVVDKTLESPMATTTPVSAGAAVSLAAIGA